MLAQSVSLCLYVQNISAKKREFPRWKFHEKSSFLVDELDESQFLVGVKQHFLVKRDQRGFYLINALIPADAVCTLQATFSFLQSRDYTAGTLRAACLPMLSPVCPSC